MSSHQVVGINTDGWDKAEGVKSEEMCFNEVPSLHQNCAMAYPRLDPVLHLARSIVCGVAFGIAVRWKCWGTIECGESLNEDGILGSTVEEDDEHGCCEANCEGQFVFVHGSWGAPVKNTLPCKQTRL